ncbi:MAG TPA: ribose 1,5-bisphosphate isomerase [Archaeoglobaceae archaeon]|nr:ribose 1,5-bisphosphate isomerase [Archaeoglobaceae archaeon]
MRVVEESATKIKTMEVRGAARIAKFAAETLKSYARSVENNFDENMKKAAEILINTRPTAVSLYNAVNYVMKYDGKSDEDKRRNLISRAEEFIEWVETAHQKIGEIGTRRIKDNSLIMTHCNSSAALSVIKTAFRSGKNIEVIATESRPRYQGHITVKELTENGIPTTLIVDSAVRYFMESVDYVIVGADTITANGALINKIGTSQIALAAKEARVPFMVAAETYKFSPKTLLGELVEIEERDILEVAPPELMEIEGLRIRNPAFDVTPRDYIDTIITEIGTVPPEMAYLVIKERLGYALFEA